MEFIVPRQLVERVIANSFLHLPYEACGLLVTKDGYMTAQPCKNDSPDQDSFDMCAEDLLYWHESGLPIVGTYHSHPRGIAVPSDGDLEMLEPDKLHMIVGMKGGIFVQLWQFRAPSQTPLLLDMKVLGT